MRNFIQKSKSKLTLVLIRVRAALGFQRRRARILLCSQRGEGFVDSAIFSLLR